MMSRNYKLLLGATLAATVASLLLEPAGSAVQEEVVERRSQVSDSPTAGVTPSQDGVPAAHLSDTVQHHLHLGLVPESPFVLKKEQVASRVVAVEAAPAPPPAPPAMAPTVAPPFLVRYIGRIASAPNTSAAGGSSAVKLIVAEGSSEFVLEPGGALPSGYVLQEMSTSQAVFAHPAFARQHILAF